MNDWSWTDGCCQAACDYLQVQGEEISPRTIARWNIEFRQNNLFNHPNPIIASGKNLYLNFLIYFLKLSSPS